MRKIARIAFLLIATLFVGVFGANVSLCKGIDVIPVCRAESIKSNKPVNKERHSKSKKILMDVGNGLKYVCKTLLKGAYYFYKGTVLVFGNLAIFSICWVGIVYFYNKDFFDDYFNNNYFNNNGGSGFGEAAQYDNSDVMCLKDMIERNEPGEDVIKFIDEKKLNDVATGYYTQNEKDEMQKELKLLGSLKKCVMKNNTYRDENGCLENGPVHEILAKMSQREQCLRNILG